MFTLLEISLFIICIILFITTFLISSIKTRIQIKNHQDIVEIYRILNKIVSNTAASRAIILSATDITKLPVLSTVIYENYEKLNRPVKNRWKSQQLDHSYISELVRLKKNGEIFIYTDLMDKGILKTLYKKEGIVSSRLSVLFYKKKKVFFFFNYFKFYYLSVNRSIEEPWTNGEMDEIRVASNSLRLIFKTNPNI